MQVGLFTPERSFIITNLDAQTIDLERFQYTQANITLFRLINFDAPSKIQEFQTIGEELDEARELCERSGLTCSKEEIDGMFHTTEQLMHISLNYVHSFIPELSPEYLQISTALIFDATMTLAEAIKQIGFDHLQIEYEQETDCFDPQSTWRKGSTINNFMKNVKIITKQHYVHFDKRFLFGRPTTQD